MIIHYGSSRKLINYLCRSQGWTWLKLLHTNLDLYYESCRDGGYLGSDR